MEKDGMMKSRRKFIKKLGGAALGTAAASAVLTTGCSISGAATEWSATYDWVVVGSGHTGCAAAIFGHDKGFKTLLLEKLEKIGGTSSQGAGIWYVPMNYLMKEAGIPDSREEAISYCRYITGGPQIDGGPYHPEHTEAFVDNAARAVEYLHSKADVKFRISEIIDSWAVFSEGGWRLKEGNMGSKRQGRGLVVEPMPAETLGEWRDKVSLSIFYCGLGEALEGQEHNPSLGRLTKGAYLGPHIGYSGPLRGVDSVALKLWRKRLGPKLDPLLKKDEELRTGGAGLVAYLFRAVIKRGIDVRTETSAERLLVENGRVVGVVVNHGGKEENIKVNKGVVLATGGGNGARMAINAGAGFSAEAGIETLERMPVPGEPETYYPGSGEVLRANYELRMRHSIVVNRFGERFADEGPYKSLGAKLFDYDSYGEHRFVNVPNYLIFDHQLIEKYSFAGRPPGETEGLDWVAQGRTLAELAQKMKIDAGKLARTVAHFNEGARRKEDPDFRRRPETLGPLEKAPFYGVLLQGPDYNPLHAGVSIAMDTHGQALHYATKKPIPGLYVPSGGGSLVYGHGYHAGLGGASTVTFNFLAAEQAASV